METTSANFHESTSPQSLHEAGPSTSGQAVQAQGESRDQELSKKRKRDKYVEKACGPCKIRKIKCGGGFPCASCVRRDRSCSDSGDGNEHDTSAPTSNGGDVRLGPNSLYQLPPLRDSRSFDNTVGLHERLAALESNLTNLTGILLQIAPLAGSNTSISGQVIDARQSHSSNSGENATGSVADAQNTQDTTGVSPKDYLSFASGKNLASERNLGETSATHALQRVEDRLNELGVPVVERESAPRTPPMTPVPWDSRQLNNKSTLDRVLRALNNNGIVPSRTHWDEYLEIFLIEVHSLYPFSHEPAISETYEQLWESLKPGNEELASELDLDKVCHLLLMLALGRCTVSSRVHKGEGLHSAGWSLYCTAMELQGSLLDIVNDDSKPLDSLHTLALVVIYLIRVDANERAQKVLSLAVIHAQHLGIHLKQTHEDMSDFDSEMFRRVWWCIYVLDRRVSLVLGRPFVIQDNNVTVELSKDLAAPTPGSIHGSVLDFYHIESGTSNFSSIHYLNVMVGYSKLVGKVWETLFGADTNTQAKPHVHEYLDALVHNWMDSVPNILVCDHEHLHQATLPTSPKLFHQRFLIRLRYLYTLILIRNPIRRLRSAPACGNDIQSEAICLQQARSIVGMFAQCSSADSVYGFPFLPYLLDATIIILACLTKLPILKPNYQETAEKAVKMLTQFCKKSWVSGKMARMIFKLEDIIPRIFASSQLHPHHSIYREGNHPQMDIPQPNQTGGFPDPHTTLPLPPHHNTSSSLSPRPMNQVWSMDNIHPETQLHEDDLASSNFQSSMIVDFPFEHNFGNTTSQAIAPLNQMGRTHGNGIRQDLSTPFLGTSDLDWLDDLISQDDRLLPLS